MGTARFKWAVFGSTVVASAGVLWATAALDGRQVRPAARPHAGAPAKEPASTDDGLLGVVTARSAVNVTSPFEATLAQVSVKLGERVSAGQELARLDAPALAQDVAMAEADLRAAQAAERRAGSELALARDSRRRTRRLGDNVSQEEHAISRSTVAQARAGLEAAKAQVKQKRANVVKMRALMEDACLRAPIAGTVTARFIEAGARVGVGMAVVRLVDDGSRYLRFAAPADRAVRLNPGQQVGVRAEAGMRLGSARIRNVATEVDAASGMIVLEADLLPEPVAASLALATGTVVRVLP